MSDKVFVFSLLPYLGSQIAICFPALQPGPHMLRFPGSVQKWQTEAMAASGLKDDSLYNITLSC